MNKYKSFKFMKKIAFLIVLSFLLFPDINAQDEKSYDLAVGIRVQKTEQLYWENGIAADFTSDFLLQKRIHLKLNFITSRIGSAFNTNAVPQESYVIGADWRFRSTKNFQIMAGFNTGFFHAEIERYQFVDLPKNSMLFSLETGLFYKFKIPMAASLSLGYNVFNGNGVNRPGTLFPLYYQASVFYYIPVSNKKNEVKKPLIQNKTTPQK